MKTINIALLVASPEWGGAQESIYQLAKYLIKINIKPTLFVNNELEEHYDDIRGLSIHALGPINLKNKFLTFLSYLRIRRNFIKLLKISSHDLLHANLTGSLYASYGISNIFKIPEIFTLHGAEIDNYFVKNSLLDYLLLKKLFKNSKIMMTSPTKGQIHDLEKTYKLKTLVVPNGVDTTEFKPIEIKKEKNVILFVGRLVELKGIFELIEVAKQLPEYEFWFAGCGPLAKYVNLTNTKNLGFKTRSELVELYNRATICCFPSHHESFGIVGLEAMACGKAIITTPLGFSEFIEDGKDGLIIEAKNTKCIKAAITRLMQNIPLREILEKNARIKALKYDWNEIVKKYYSLYRYMVVK
jgi:glycosyltransferase involved in cell wall biosynthesis